MKSNLKELNIHSIRNKQLEILSEVSNYCKNNDIPYFLTGGTLLGAIRHKGYIPWDDDIDIVIPRKYYDELVENFNIKNIKKLRLISFQNNKDFPYAYAKISDLDTVLIEEIDSKFQIGVNIDVFPLDNLPNDFNEIEKLNRYLKIFRSMLTIKNIKISCERRHYKNAVLFFLKILLKPISSKYIIANIDKLSKKYKNEDMSKYVAVLSLFTYGRGEIMERNFYKDSINYDFEDRKFEVPIGFDNILKNLYGDYNKLPPIEKQITHHKYKAYELVKE